MKFHYPDSVKGCALEELYENSVIPTDSHLETSTGIFTKGRLIFSKLMKTTYCWKCVIVANLLLQSLQIDSCSNLELDGLIVVDNYYIIAGNVRNLQLTNYCDRSR